MVYIVPKDLYPLTEQADSYKTMVIMAQNDQGQFHFDIKIHNSFTCYVPDNTFCVATSIY